MFDVNLLTSVVAIRSLTQNGQMCGVVTSMQLHFYMCKWPRLIANRLDIYPIWKTARKLFKASKIHHVKRDVQFENKNSTLSLTYHVNGSAVNFF